MTDPLRKVYEDKASAGTLDADAEQLTLVAALDRIGEGLESAAAPHGPRFFRKAPDPVPGLYIWGGVGTGKSMLMDLFFEHLAIDGKRRIHFHAFMQEVHAGLHAAHGARTEDAIAPVAEHLVADLRLLALDELAIGDIADAMIVGRLFQALFDAGVTVVTTSNRHPDDLYKDGLQRDRFLPFIALLKERLTIHRLATAADYRRSMLSGAEVYFTPADAAARDRIEAIWTHLTGGAPADALRLTVQGHEVTLPAFRNGVARATFRDLCGRPLGPADYLAIADALRVLILEDIPRLSRANFNEAKRFVTLIDALYEARIRLIASAAAAPEMLFVEGEGAFEFQRAASRLREMQAEGWAA